MIVVSCTNCCNVVPGGTGKLLILTIEVGAGMYVHVVPELDDTYILLLLTQYVMYSPFPDNARL